MIMLSFDDFPGGSDGKESACNVGAAAAKSLQSCLTLCNPIDGSPPGTPIPGILQARTLEWVAISFSSGWKWKVKVNSLTRVRLLAIPWTAAWKELIGVYLPLGGKKRWCCGLQPQIYGSASCPLPTLSPLSPLCWLMPALQSFLITKG